MDRPESRPPPAPPPSLSPERWRTLEPLLDAVIELAPEWRSAFLDDTCGADAALRAELVAMLAECAEDDARLCQPAAQRFAVLLDGRDEFAQLRAALAGRYHVERELGRGGMGAVYLARDLRHERDIAVKVLAPELADGSNAARFLEEIRLTARLRHPHILPLFDSGVADGRPWYVTPYVEGGTLRDRLVREGAPPLAEALRLLREVASALAYAHARGVVHRDVKPENVLLDAGGSVLGDFGIARAIERATGAGALPALAALTAPGFGTPAYMAPEQGRPGAPADHRVDLYALGVVACEILSGHLPLGGRWPEGVAAPAELVMLISGLLAERPEDRLQSADELLRALDAIGSSPDNPGKEPMREAARRAAWRRAALSAVAGVSVLAVASATGWWLHTGRVSSSLSARHVLVVPFENATGDPALAPLGRMAADWVAQGLAQTGAVDVSSEVVSPEARGGAGLREVARQRSAGTLVSGTYYLDGDSVRLQARVINVADGTLLRSVAPVAAAREAPQLLIEPLRQRVMAILAVVHDPRYTGLQMGTPPPTFAAYEQFLAGRDLFSAGNWEGALPFWARAAALDSSYMQPLLNSVFVYTNQGRYAEADSLARRIARREMLVPFDRAMLAYERGLIDGDNLAALAGTRAMVRAAPGAQLPYYLHAVAATYANRPREALAAARNVNNQGGPLATAWASANYWAVVTLAQHLLGRHEAELQAARTARGAQPGNRTILWFELRARAALGRLGELETALDELEALPATPSGWALSFLLNQLADELDAHGHPASARAVLQRADRWQRTRGEGAERPVSALYERARTLFRLGDYDAADLLLARLAAEQPEDPRYLGYRGLVAVRQHRIADAQQIAEQLRTLRVPYDHGQTTYARAQLAAQLGDPGLALALLRQALAEGFVFGTVLHTAPELAPLRDEPEFRELLRPKG